MIRKFNYTNRRKIPREAVTISVHSSGTGNYFNASIHKESLKFPDTARVYVEPYYGPTYLRFDFGDFGKLQQPSDTDISELKRISDKVLFRVKIVDESTDNGLILGIADKIPLADDGEPEGKTTILYVNPVLMETEEVWRLNFDIEPDGMPILEVNNSIQDIRDIAKVDPVFFAIIYPAAVRQILTRVVDEGDFDNQSDSWNAKWIRFAEVTLGVSGTPEDNDDREKCNEWISEVVKSFCRKYKTLDKYKKTVEK